MAGYGERVMYGSAGNQVAGSVCCDRMKNAVDDSHLLSLRFFTLSRLS